MIRTMLCAIAGVLLTGSLYAQEKEKKPDAKAEVVKEKNPDGAKKVVKEEVKKDAPDAKKKVIKEGAVKEGAKGEAAGHKGRLTKLTLESGIIRVTVDGKEFEFPVTETTFVALRASEHDGKQVVHGLQLFNASEEPKADGVKKQQFKKEAPKNDGDKPVKEGAKDAGDKPVKEGAKNPGDKPADKPKEKKPE
jgi:hypothetical protein